MFDGFQLDRVAVGEVTLRVRYGGQGEPVVLLHGHPRTHMTWHRVAPELAKSFFVVSPDLRGYGQSTLPPDAPGHAQSSKRAMAGDVAALMRHLGRDRFPVVGHDRGALVAFSSIPGTTKPKKRQKRSPRHFCSSSGRNVSAGPRLALAAAGPRPPGRAA